MSLSGFALYSLTVRLFAAFVFSGVGMLVLLRARNHWFGWFTAHVMFFMNAFAYYPIIQVAQLLPAGIIELSALFWPTILVYFFLFPNGRFVPGWLGLPVIVYALAQTAAQLTGLLAQIGLIAAERFEFLVPIFDFLIPIIFLMALGSQVFRYVRVSSVVERAQTRWFILSIVFLIGVPSIGELFRLERIFLTFEWDLLSFGLIPIALAIAILRYRLWDIDVIIRRTLQYALVTVLLAVVYFGSVVILQGLVGSLTGDVRSPVITVVITLAIAALFNPLRRRVQDFIDRRFYRSKFDAEQALVRFAAAARDEVDMDRIAAALMGLAAETIQPERVSLWLRQDAEHGSKPFNG